MKAYIDGNAVCVVSDDCVDLQESPAVFGTLREFAAAAFLAFFATNNGADLVVFDLGKEDVPLLGLDSVSNGKVARVTIEWAYPVKPSSVYISNNMEFSDDTLRRMITGVLREIEEAPDGEIKI